MGITGTEYKVLLPMDFEGFLKSKKIDADLFKKRDENQFFAFKALFDQVHPNSFVQQKLFLINKIRRKYLLKAEGAEKQVSEPSKMKSGILPEKPKLG